MEQNHHILMQIFTTNKYEIPRQLERHFLCPKVGIIRPVVSRKRTVSLLRKLCLCARLVPMVGVSKSESAVTVNYSLFGGMSEN